MTTPSATTPASVSSTAATDLLAPRRPVPEAPLDLSIPHRLHVVGVGGPGMSAIAIALAEMGHDVSGSDLREHPVLERVRAAMATVHIGHDRSYVHGVDAVTASTAIPERNIELDEARTTGVTVLRRAGMLASICAQAKSIAVAGTHGKTTSTSMLMLMLAEAGLRPNFVVGGDVTDVGTGAQWTGGEWLVVEADESDGTHLELPLHGTILTNVEVDHLDHYGSLDAIIDSFDRYLAQIPGPKVVSADDPVAARLARRHDAITFGTAGDAQVRAVDIRVESGASMFRVERTVPDGPPTVLGEIELPMRGLYNVLNATGAIAMALELGVDFDDIRISLAKFGGVARRFDVRGSDGGATFVDDYAHLPSEIRAVLGGARHSGDGWKRVIAVFQPNRYNRISEIWQEYADAFGDADLIVLTDIYASGTTPIPGVTGKLIVNAVAEANPGKRVVWLPKRDDLISFVAGEARDGDVVVSMGCGDIASFPSEVLDARQRR
ncbi:UDP-N-acetylmuramate--L-alanine ligase [Ilumatobacter coccineus]|uniref:UDP-N-acetylmuramate--L-alanine ligase n=1 Tax=Ilumatobacter coccineus (strain NBRC 103263 / KCTC 29153 / YM16-304) TaxID=1313172 RepID=A0A6C7E703_ILUCY|nr:UDP-N-acetylmuramate--L-alanine ligase [Ilumatobacter coccineus]BAN02261.1 UDP-N-acetylmuramate--L-alanine ligase [Ilumatobacter coccineus YM16-304]